MTPQPAANPNAKFSIFYSLSRHIVGSAHGTREHKRHESDTYAQNIPINRDLVCRAYASGARGREFESPRSDQFLKGLPNASQF